MRKSDLYQGFSTGISSQLRFSSKFDPKIIGLSPFSSPLFPLAGNNWPVPPFFVACPLFLKGRELSSLWFCFLCICKVGEGMKGIMSEGLITLHSTLSGYLPVLERVVKRLLPQFPESFPLLLFWLLMFRWFHPHLVFPVRVWLSTWGDRLGLSR